MKLRSREFKVNDEKVQQAFVYSLMSVVDESEHMDKYEDLSFVEYLEMLCRLALELIVIKEPSIHGPEHKVFRLLQLIQNQLVNDVVIKASDLELKPIDVDY